jgi:1-piperideine-2-carboxylate/1-pyrroline-2-carboxylate reductase [NAD(P)H]
MQILDARLTAGALPWEALFAALEDTIRDANAGHAVSPPRMSVPLGDGAVWLLMPALSRSADIGACKLITVHGSNRQRGLPSIQGDILVIRASTGERLALLDGPTVTARRTAAVTTLGVRRILEARAAATSADTDKPASCLIIGCGVQGRSHLEALHAAFPALQFLLCSRTAASAQSLAEHAADSGISARTVPAPEAALSDVDLVVCCTDASAVCLNQPPRQGAIIAAIGSFKPEMSELSPAVMEVIGRNIMLDSADAGHEAGELIQNGIDPDGLPTLFTWHPKALPAVTQTVLFKSCGNALWDLAAAQAATTG